MTVNGISARQQMVKTINIDYQSDIDDRTYKGAFTIKKISIRDLAALGVRKAQLNGGMHYDSDKPGMGVDSQTDMFNTMVAQLELSVKNAPAWWNLDEITDVNLLGTVYKEVMDFENSFLRRKLEKALAGGSGEGSGETDLQKSNPGGAAVQVVGKEVQDSLEP